ncbi:alpha/beta hydrolase [Streptomyces sp. NPDC002265]|uniref:alpha/beta fold hydrolase n=1 Tax=Streptomyces sp. NPDC002265 TaxID=3154415 RepID=UPI00332D7AFB
MDRRSFGKLFGVGVGVTGAAAASTAGVHSVSEAWATAGRGAPAGGDVSAEETEAGAGSSFGPLKQIRAGELNVGYAEAGPAHGPVALLLHGWPYDIHSYEAATPLLTAHGYRVIVPYLRGYGTTTFLSPKTPRNGEQAAVAMDIIALMDALHIDRAVIGGFDWGGRTADIIAAQWPERCKALVSMGGYLILNQKALRQPAPPAKEYPFWYAYYFCTDRGELGLKEYRHDLAKLVWHTASPTWRFSDATFDRTAKAFDNPDYVPVVISNYRWRLELAPTDPRYADLEARLAEGPAIRVPTVGLDGELDPFTPSGGDSSYRDKYTGPYVHRTLKGIGHNVPQEAPAAFAQAVLEADRMARG